MAYARQGEPIDGGTIDGETRYDDSWVYLVGDAGVEPTAFGSENLFLAAHWENGYTF
jgi:hypothetical protein